MNFSRTTLISALLILIFCFVLTIWRCWNNLVPIKVEHPALLVSDKGTIYFTKGRKPLGIRVRVLTFSGEPIAGTTVKIRNMSGGNTGITNDSGFAVIDVSESTIEQVLVDGESYFGSFNSGPSNHIHVGNGISILILRNR